MCGTYTSQGYWNFAKTDSDAPIMWGDQPIDGTAYVLEIIWG